MREFRIAPAVPQRRTPASSLLIAAGVFCALTGCGANPSATEAKPAPAPVAPGDKDKPVAPAPRADRTPAVAPAAMKPYEETIPGFDVKFELVPIPGGTLVMGSPETEAARKKDEGPQHEVVIKPFWMGKCEVTWEEFDIYAYKRDVRKKAEQGVNLEKQPEIEKLADAVSRPTAPYTDMTFGWGRGGKPALCFTHHAAMEYCRWLSIKTGKVYRLPTEAEWEYAARGGAKTAYFWGDGPAKAGDFAWFADNSEKKPHPVGEKKPNPFGLHDILGNVAEWCLDHYEAKLYAKRKPGEPTMQPVLLPDAEEYSYVARGGAWSDKIEVLRCAARQASDEDWSVQDPQFPKSVWWHTDAKFVGFRVVRPLDEQENLKGLKSKIQLTSSRQE